MFNGFSQDLRFGIRRLAHEKLFVAIVVLALGLGLGANTTVFTIADAVLFRPLPFPDADRLMVVNSANPSRNQSRFPMSYPDFVDWKAQSKSFEDLAAWVGTGVNMSDPNTPPERYNGARMSANSFALIGAKPVVGRDLTPEDQKLDAPRVALIGYGIWQNRYGGKDDIVGRTVRMNDQPTTIIGVMPKGFRFPVGQDVWFPLQVDSGMEKRNSRQVVVYGKLAPGKTIADSRAEGDLFARRMQTAYPADDKDITSVISTYNDQYNGGQISTIFMALLGAVGFVLLIVCANVTNLLLARSLARTREMSIRSAMGATRWRMIRQLLIECVLMGLLGGVLGVGAGYLGVRGFDKAVADVGKPYWIVFHMDLRVYLYLAAICIGSSLVFGLLPALRLSRVHVSPALKEGERSEGGGTRARWIAATLVVAQLSLALMLLTGSGLMIRSFMKLYGMSENFNSERLLTMRFNLVETKYPKLEDKLRFYEAVLPKIREIPGTESVAFGSSLPQLGAAGWRVELEGSAPEEDSRRKAYDGLVVTPGYFDTIGKPVVRGRDFSESDGTAGHEAVIINQLFAKSAWPNQEPLGKRLRLRRDKPTDTWLTVVGVVPDVKQNDPQRLEPNPVLYIPYRQEGQSGMFILAKLANPQATAGDLFRRAVQSVDQDLPVTDIATLQKTFEQQRWPFRVFGTLFTIFAGFALILAAVGLYAVVSYSVNQRTREIGLRMALGASGRDILVWIMHRGVLQLGLGVVIGLAGAVGVGRVLKSLIVQISATDPVTFGSVAGVLLISGVLAAFLPARRATRVDPMVALRYD
jgi:putative ABC transport system permease protein